MVHFGNSKFLFGVRSISYCKVDLPRKLYNQLRPQKALDQAAPPQFISK